MLEFRYVTKTADGIICFSRRTLDEIVRNTVYRCDELLSVDLFTGVEDEVGMEICQNDLVEIDGVIKLVEFPFIELLENYGEVDIGKIVGCIHLNPELYAT